MSSPSKSRFRRFTFRALNGSATHVQSRRNEKRCSYAIATDCVGFPECVKYQAGYEQYSEILGSRAYARHTMSKIVYRLRGDRGAIGRPAPFAGHAGRMVQPSQKQSITWATLRVADCTYGLAEDLEKTTRVNEWLGVTELVQSIYKIVFLLSVAVFSIGRPAPFGGPASRIVQPSHKQRITWSPLRVADFPYRLEDDLEKTANLSAFLWFQRFYQRLSTLFDCRETVLEDRFEQSFLGTKMILNGGSVALPRRNRNLPQGNSINSMLAKAIFGCL